MKNLKIEIKWAIYFAVMSLVWMLLEKWSGLHGKYIDYHLYLTNLFAIPAILFMVLALKDKKRKHSLILRIMRSTGPFLRLYLA